MGRATFAAVLVLLAVSGLRAQPANDDCADATVIGSLPFTDTVDTTAATTEADDPTYECFGDPHDQGTHSVWYQYTSVAGGPIEIDTFGSDYDTVVTVWRGACSSLGDLAACNNDDWDFDYVGEQSRLVVTLAVGETVYVEVVSFAPAGGNLVLNVKASSVFQVTEEAVYRTQRPDAAAGSDGTFVIVWEDREAYGIMGRRFCDTGIPVGAPFEISGPSDARLPRVVRSGEDGFVVVWVENFTLQGRRLSVSGVPLGPQFEVADDYPSYAYYNLGLAGDGAGRFIVTWETYGDGDDDGVVARRFDAANAPLGPQFAVNTYTTGSQRHPSVAADSAGNFIVAWQSDAGQDGYGFGVFGRRYDANGTALGGEFQVNVSTTDSQTSPAVTRDASGNFVIVWLDEDQSCGQRCIIGRRYDAAGSPLSGEFVVSDGTSGPPGYYVSIDADTSATGDFTVAWAKEIDYPRARSFEADGTPLGSAFNAGFVEHDYQRNTRLAVAPDGDFVVVWDWAPTGSAYRIMAHAVTQNPSCPVQPGCPSSPRLGCKQPTIDLKGNLTLKDKTPDARDTVTWKWVKGEATTVGDIGDALTADFYSFCLYDGNGVLLAEATVPPGGTCDAIACWKDLGGLGFKYADRTGSNGDVRKLVLKSGDEGGAKVIVKVQGESLALPALPPVLPLRAQVASTTATCWEAEFQAAGVTKSTPEVFRAKPSIGSASGAFVE